MAVALSIQAFFLNVLFLLEQIQCHNEPITSRVSVSQQPTPNLSYSKSHLTKNITRGSNREEKAPIIIMFWSRNQSTKN
jgi:hypothetical protein